MTNLLKKSIEKTKPPKDEFLKNLMKSPYKGGPTEAATFEYLKSLGTKIDPITKKEVPTTTLQQLIKEHGPKKEKVIIVKRKLMVDTLRSMIMGVA